MPQFSVIIPCYNSKATIGRALQSVADQHLKDKIEVILVDDCSTEDFTDEVAKFDGILDYRIVKTESNCGPGMARQRGMDEAKGDWIVFCDHDDTFVPNTFNRVRTIIRNNPSRFILQTRFQEVSIDGQATPYTFEKGMNWIHGKFFKTSFLREHNLRFKEGLETHEDIYFSVLTREATEHFGTPCLLCDLITYQWFNLPTSFSHSRDAGIDLFEGHFEDYVESVLGPVEALREILSPQEVLSQGVSCLLFIYFYSEGFERLERGHKERDDRLFTEGVQKLCGWINYTPQQLVDYIDASPTAFNTIRQKSFDSVGQFIEKHDWREKFLSVELENGEKN